MHKQVMAVTFTTTLASYKYANLFQIQNCKNQLRWWWSKNVSHDLLSRIEIPDAVHCTICSMSKPSLHFTKSLATRAWRRHEQQWLTSSGNGRGRCWKPPSMLSPAVLSLCRGRHSIACEGLHVVSIIPLPSG